MLVLKFKEMNDTLKTLNRKRASFELKTTQIELALNEIGEEESNF